MEAIERGGRSLINLQIPNGDIGTDTEFNCTAMGFSTALVFFKLAWPALKRIGDLPMLYYYYLSPIEG